MANVIKVEGQHIDVTLGERQIIGTWTCDPKNINHLYLNGSPLTGSSITFDFPQISWSAGVGWPYYDVPEPRQDKSPGDRVPTAHRHCIILEISGTMFEPPFRLGNSCSANHTGDILFYVNDDRYDDNTGSFTVTVTSIVP